MQIIFKIEPVIASDHVIPASDHVIPAKAGISLVIASAFVILSEAKDLFRHCERKKPLAPKRSRGAKQSRDPSASPQDDGSVIARSLVIASALSSP